jgi:hypothetical protein
MKQYKPGDKLPLTWNKADVWNHGFFTCPRQNGYTEKVSNCLKRQETSAAKVCFSKRCPVGIKISTSFENKSVHQLRQIAGIN